MRIGAVIVACLMTVAAPAWATVPAAPDAAVPPAAAPPAAGDTGQKSADLDQLFAELQAAATLAAGKQIELQIIAAWLESGDQPTDEIMAQAIIAMNSGDYVAALGYLDTIVSTHPDYVEGWNKRATLYYMMNDYKDSLADIARTLALEPRHFGALAGLGMIRMSEGDKVGALDAFKRAYAVDPALDNIKQVIDEIETGGGQGI